jgi:hypothetical protein
MLGGKRTGPTSALPKQGKAAQFPDSRRLAGHETFQLGQGRLDPIFLRLFAVLLLSSTTPPQLHTSGLRDKYIARMVRFQMRVNHENSFYGVWKLIIHMAASDSESQLGEIAAQRGAHQRVSTEEMVYQVAQTLPVLCEGTKGLMKQKLHVSEERKAIPNRAARLESK